MNNFKVIKYNKIFMSISLFLVVLSLLSLLIFGLNLGIDFTGGSVFRYAVDSEKTDFDEATQKIQSYFEDNDVKVEQIRNEDVFIKITTPPIDSTISTDLQNNLAIEGVTQESFESIGSVIGSETIKKALTALFLAFVGILFYIAYAFRNIPKPYSSFKFGAAALVAMMHDAVIVVGVFALLGHFMGVEVDLFFITALLTIIGFSVHDTIIVFDRIRENLRHKSRGKTLGEIVDISIVETIRRSLGTSATVLIILLCLLLFGGYSIRDFILAFVIGVIVGTYSSIFVASPILIYWESSKISIKDEIQSRVKPSKSKKKKKKKILK